MFMPVTTLVSVVAILLGASVLGWIFGKVGPEAVTGLHHVPKTVVVVTVATTGYLYLMTRPAIVGPYEQWTFENIGGQLVGGGVAAVVMIWMGGGEEA